MKNLKENSKHQSNQGFVRIILFLIIILVILSLIGLDANGIWHSIFRPIFAFVGNLILLISSWLVNVLRNVWSIITLQN